MIGIPYINSLFSAILDVSLVMGGRFYICPKQGSEMNNANIAELVMNAPPNGIKWPAALMMPPKKSGNFQFSLLEVTDFDLYTIQMMFLRPASYTAYNQPSQPLPNTPISTHTVVDTWHDMSRCAEDFMKALRGIIDSGSLQGTLTISERLTPVIQYITEIGNDKLSGALLTFNLLMNGGCELEDYPSDYLTRIELPALTDIHPTHVNS